MDKNRILEVAKKENNDELKDKKHQTAQMIGNAGVIIVMAILGIVESFRYKNAIYIILIPLFLANAMNRLLRIIFKKAYKIDIILLSLEFITLVVIVIVYILRTWLYLW